MEEGEEATGKRQFGVKLQTSLCLSASLPLLPPLDLAALGPGRVQQAARNSWVGVGVNPIPCIPSMPVSGQGQNAEAGTKEGSGSCQEDVSQICCFWHQLSCEVSLSVLLGRLRGCHVAATERVLDTEKKRPVCGLRVHLLATLQGAAANFAFKFSTFSALSSFVFWS